MKVVIVTCFDTYEDRLLLLRDYFQNNGDSVTVIASDYMHFKKHFRTQKPENFTLLPTKPYKKNISIDRLLSHHRFAKDAFIRVREIVPDLLWVLIPANSLVKEAAQYKKENPATKLIIDVIDMWPETMPMSKFKQYPPFSYWKSLRDKYVNTADIIVTECNLYKTVLNQTVDKNKLATLYLAQTKQTAEQHPNPPKDRWSLCYLGSINNIIDIPCICEILKNLPIKVKKPVLNIIGDGEKRDELIQAAKAVGVEIKYHGKVYDTDTKQAIFDGCHFGLNVMKPTVFVGLTMKSIDYFAAGLPIINNIRGDTWQLVEENIGGVNYNVCQKEFENSIYGNYRPNITGLYNKYFTVEAFETKLSSILGKL